MRKKIVVTLALIFLASVSAVFYLKVKRVAKELVPVTIIEIDPNLKSLNWLTTFFQKHNIQNADELALALLLAPAAYREVLAAIAVQEGTHGDTTVVGRAGEKGIFQVREKYWGKVPRDIAGQVLQASYIYASLHKIHGSEYRAVKAYNGSGYKAQQYAYAVLAMKGE